MTAAIAEAAALRSQGSDESAPTIASARPVLIEMRGVSKAFPGVKALDGVDFDLRAGEVHVLFGENGAGKSTLINIIAGTFAQDSGEYILMGEPARGLTPHRARVQGISPVFQEFSLVPEMTVGLRGSNLLDDDVRNSASFKKDEVLQPGRNVRLYGIVRLN